MAPIHGLRVWATALRSGRTSSVVRCFSATSLEESRVKIETRNEIAYVTLNRPSKLNALDVKMLQAIADAAKSIRADKSVRAVILSGAGKAFCAGLDVKGVASNPDNVETLLNRPADSKCNLVQDVGYLWRSLPVPVLAVTHGVCFGGGLQISLGADFRFTTADCRFSVMEIKWGMIPDMSGSITLRELVPIDVAKELTMTGREFLGTEAKELNLVTRVCASPMDDATKLAEALVKRSPDAVASAKELFNSTWRADEATALKTFQVETELQRRLLFKWNMVASAGRAFTGFKVPYANRSPSWDNGQHA